MTVVELAGEEKIKRVAKTVGIVRIVRKP